MCISSVFTSIGITIVQLKPQNDKYTRIDTLLLEGFDIGYLKELNAKDLGHVNELNPPDYFSCDCIFVETSESPDVHYK